MKMKRTVTVLLATVVTLVGLGVFAAPAQASIPASCGTGGHEICLFTSPSYTGSVRHFQLASGCQNLVYPYDNNVSSMANGTLSHEYTVWEGYNCTGFYAQMSPGEKHSTLPTEFLDDNEASSVSFP